MNTVNCASCGAELQRPDHRLKRSPKQYCNRKCMGEAWQGERNPRHNPNIETGCGACGKRFTLWESQYKKAVIHYCSKKCLGTANGQRIKGERNSRWTGGEIATECKKCGKAFSALRNKGEIRSYCSNKCRTDAIRGAGHPFWKGGTVYYYGPNWKEQKRAALLRDNYTCQRCMRRRSKERIQLHVHHIKPFREFGYIGGENENYLQANDLTNLLTLCNKCHKVVEPPTVTRIK